MQKQTSYPVQNIKKPQSADIQVHQCKTNQQDVHIKNTGGKVGRNIAYRLYLKVDKLKKRHQKSIKIKNDWKVKYLKLLEKYKDLKEVFEIYKHLP